MSAFLNNTTVPPLDEYIALYKKIFVFPEEGTKGVKPKVPEVPILKKTKDYIYIDLSKLDVPSIYINVFDQEGIQANGLNIGDEYSYVDFKKHIRTGVISFYRRNKIDNELLPMQYTTDNELHAIMNDGTRYKFGAIIDELQSVLTHISQI